MNRLRTRTSGSSARSSNVVETVTSREPVREWLPPSTHSGQVYVAAISRVARTGPGSPAVTTTDVGRSITVSLAGGE